MKLHVYDHCPFCIRARMAFALKNIPYTLVIQANDDEDTPIQMIGQKMLPILEDQDVFMGESLDIVHKVDAMSGELLFSGEADPKITDWLTEWGPVMQNLTIPRNADDVFPEFATQSARDYYTNKKQQQFGDFPTLIAQTPEFIAQLEPGLKELENILPDAEGASITDILLFPTLRRLSIVDELTLPDKVFAYIKRMAERTEVQLIPDMRKSA